MKRLRFVVAQAGWFLRDLGGYGVWSGRWWMALLIPLLTVAAIAVTAVKVAVPTVVYAFF